MHDWAVSPEEAIKIQRRLARRVSQVDQRRRVRTVAGIDVGYDRSGRLTRAAVVVLRLPDLELVECAVSRRPTTFPYIPGLLSFREVPAVLGALAKLEASPDLLVCDGQGRAHPRRFGLACHLGVVSGLAAIGVAKSRLIGTHQTVPERRSAWVPLDHEGERIGAVLRTRTGVKPVFVSVGHRVSLDRAVALTLEVTPRYRLPETTRQAHRLASASEDPEV
jgi:deoxyribonuclease V